MPDASVGISRVAVRLPSRVEAVDDILARNGVGRRDRWMFAKLHGLCESYSLAEGEKIEDLLVQAGLAALDGQSVRLVIYGHTLLPADPEQGGAFRERLRAGLGLPGCEFYGVSHVNCVSVLRSIELGRRYLARPGADPADQVLVLGGDQGSFHDLARIVPGVTVAGDGVAAILVQGAGAPRRPRYRYLGGAGARDVRFHRNLRMPPEEAAAFAASVRRHAVRTVRQAAREAGLKGLDQVDWLMPHLSNRMLWRGFAADAQYPGDRICLDLVPQRGHNFGTDALMALDHAERAGRLGPGDRCALVAVGQGSYVQSMIVEVEEDS